MEKETWLKISDVADIIVGKNIDKLKLNDEGKGLPYIVGASSLQNQRLECKSFCEDVEGHTISQLGDVIISIVGTLGKLGINNIGDCVLSKHVCAVRFVSDILPEYGLICLQASLATVVAECESEIGENSVGYSRKLDLGKIGDIPLLLINIRRQRGTIDRMLELATRFTIPRLYNESPMPDIESLGELKAYMKEVEKDMQDCIGRMVQTLGELEKEFEAEFEAPTPDQIQARQETHERLLAEMSQPRHGEPYSLF